MLVNKLNVIGIDEAGIGCVAGPLTVCAVLGTVEFFNEGVRDSKSVKSYKELKRLAEDILTRASCEYIEITPETINEYGTWESWEMGVNELIFRMRARYGMKIPVLLDGNKIPKGQYRVRTQVKADASVFQVAAASIVAKFVRKSHMIRTAKRFPKYGFESNDGYGTAQHIKAILKYGLTIHHRKVATETLLKNHKGKQNAR